MRAFGPVAPWRAPHLPFFLLAALWAAVAPLVWLLPLVADPVAWHRQELMLGMVGAAMAGYLLSALPHWIKRAGRGWRPGQRALRLLVLAWVAGRIAAQGGETDGIVLAGIAAFPLGLSFCLLRSVLSARLWSRVPIALAPVGLLIVGLRLRLTGDGLSAVLALALLIALVGGRIVPAFLAARAGLLPPSPPILPRLADLALALALIAPLAGWTGQEAGALTLIAAAGQGARIWCWPLRAARQADLAMLVIAWCWLPLGLLLTGLALVTPGIVLLPAGLHALTMGAMGGMILAVMARASMRRLPGALLAGTAHKAAFGLVMLATLLRFAYPAWSAALPLSAAIWCLGWAAFALVALRALWSPLPHPILSAARVSVAAPQD
ncbi:NnrS family protein [Gemmobacter caeruleus]|uniref:NnrS family protein n=1 Tax=Gemmobacter caeruleus TaxID=2595004 RepID=UPI0011F00247|nr:NnrS family protein [Gemmobacter caeruleus]